MYCIVNLIDIVKYILVYSEVKLFVFFVGMFYCIQDNDYQYLFNVLVFILDKYLIVEFDFRILDSLILD